MKSKIEHVSISQHGILSGTKTYNVVSVHRGIYRVNNYYSQTYHSGAFKAHRLLRGIQLAAMLLRKEEEAEP